MFTYLLVYVLQSRILDCTHGCSICVYLSTYVDLNRELLKQCEIHTDIKNIYNINININ